MTEKMAKSPAGKMPARAMMQRTRHAWRNNWTPNVRDQRRRAVGAPLADLNLSAPMPVAASGVPTRDDRCIA
jgi:hypothetical protein